MVIRLLLKPESSRLVQRLFKTQWVFPFLSPALGSATVILALKILVTLLTTSRYVCNSPTAIYFSKFRASISGSILLILLLTLHF